MQEKNREFFSLISNAMKLEAKYERTNERYNHILDISNRFGKGDNIEISIAKSESETNKKKLDELVNQISKLQLYSTMQNYYNLYKERSQLVKNFWNVKTEIGYISSTFVFAYVEDKEVNMALADKRENLKEQNELTKQKIKDITERMRVIKSV